jgi:hypothetical protein
MSTLPDEFDVALASPGSSRRSRTCSWPPAGPGPRARRLLDGRSPGPPARLVAATRQGRRGRRDLGGPIALAMCSTGNRLDDAAEILEAAFATAERVRPPARSGQVRLGRISLARGDLAGTVSPWPGPAVHPG